MSTIRSFIAIELSDEARIALTDLQHRLKSVGPPRSVRWIPPQNIHLTLHFLGDIPVGQVEKITAAIQTSASNFQPFSLILGDLGCFPNLRRPRIVWVGILGQTEQLLQLHQAIGEQLNVIDFTPETRPYSPHLTIGRVKKGIPSRDLARLRQVLEQERVEVEQLVRLDVTKLSLMKSELRPSGVVYTELAVGKLANP